MSAEPVTEFKQPTTFEESVKLNSFLMEQLHGAVTMLRARDETEERCNARYRTIYRATEERLQKQVEEIKQRSAEAIKKTQVDATRYRFIREHQVRVWKFGIAATAEQLDRALDEQLERAQKVKA